MNTDKKTILIIEDNYDLWAGLFEQLFPKNEDYVIFFNKGDANIHYTLKEENIRLSDIDLIISDYFLPGTDGVQWINDNIKNKDSQLPIIFLTASTDVSTIKKTVLGQNVFFKKDLDLVQLKQTADELIQRRHINKQYPLFNEYFNIWIKPDQAKYRELCYVAYTNASRFLEGFFGHSKYHSVFNTHGLIHAQNVVNNLAKLLLLAPDYFKSDDDGVEVNYFVLAYLAALFHDLGMIPQSYDDKIELVDFKKTRKNHAKKTAYMIISGELEDMLKFKFVEYLPQGRAEDFKHKLAFVCLYHGCKYEFENFIDISVVDELADFEHSEGYSYNIFRDKNYWYDIIKEINKEGDKLRTIAALVALADKLDYNISRVPVGPARKSPLRSMRDEFEYLKNECFDAFKISNTNEGPLIYIYIKQTNANVETKIDDCDEKELFDSFVNSINSNNGAIKDNPVYLASLSLMHCELSEKFDNILKAVKVCEHDYLKRINIEFKCHTASYKDFCSPVNVYNNSSCEIEYINANINDYEKSLFNTIFDNKYNELKVNQITEGYSSEKVFLVSCIKQEVIKDINYETQKKIVKIGNYENIHKEFQNYYNIALSFIPPKSLMGFAEEYKYLDKGAIVGSIVTTEEGKINNMHDVLLKDANCLTDSISKSLGIFFDKIHPIEKQTQIVTDVYKNLFDKRYKKILKLNKSYSSTITPLYKGISELFKMINTKNMHLTLSYVHGDFTFRNILQAGTGNDELVFIDFADSGKGHFFMDFAKLDHYVRHELLKYNAMQNSKLVEFEKALINNHQEFEKNDSYFDQAKSVSTEIYSVAKQLIDKHTISCQFDFEFNLAKLYIYFWSLTYSQNFDLAIDKRIAICESYLCWLNKHLK
jgi:CheY-like chemotaxis protein